MRTYKEIVKNYILILSHIAGQVCRELQSKSNNAQLNKSKLENLQIYMPDNTEEIGKLIYSNLID